MEKLHNIIYKISNNFDNMFYIGAHSTNDLNDKYMGSGTRLKRAIKKHSKENFKREILHDVENSELMFFIEQLIVDEDFVKREDTYNCKTGGINKFLYCEETRQKISKALKGKRQSEETIRKAALSRTGLKRSDETKRKMSIANKGRIVSEETKLKLSLINSGKPAWNKGLKTGKPAWNRGIPTTDEVKRKLSLSHIGKKMSEEAKKNMSVSHIGRKLSEEHKQKIGNGLKGRKFPNGYKKKIIC